MRSLYLVHSWKASHIKKPHRLFAGVVEHAVVVHLSDYYLYNY